MKLLPDICDYEIPPNSEVAGLAVGLTRSSELFRVRHTILQHLRSVKPEPTGMPVAYAAWFDDETNKHMLTIRPAPHRQLYAELIYAPPMKRF